MAYLYIDGMAGLTKNPSKAYGLLKHAADHNHAFAQYSLGMLSEKACGGIITSSTGTEVVSGSV